MKKLCLAALTLLAAGNTFAGTQTWSFTDSSSTVSHGYGNTMELSSGSGGDQITLSVSAWASTDSRGDSGSTCGYSYGGTGTQVDADPCIDDAELMKYTSGLGIINRDEYSNNQTAAPQHAIDNIKNGGIATDFDYEMVLLTFSSEVNLTDLKIGWSLCGTNACTTKSYADGGKDADVTMLAHDGSANSSFFSGSTRWADITNQGWNLVDHYAGVREQTTITTPSTAYSKHWLVGAYNNIFDHSTWSLDNDAFKLAGLTTVSKDTGTADPVNAPATIGLFGLIALGLLYRRRK